ncbi:MAG: PQQ-dependent sugar dehydrogenase [Actinomycetes bacterium]
MRSRRAFAALFVVMTVVACGGGADDDARPSSTSRATSTTAGPTSTTSGDPKAVRLEEIAAGLDEPVAMATLGDTIHLAERAGRVVRLDPREGPVGVLDLRDRTESGFSEQGLLGLAFSNDGRWLYTASTRKPDGALTIDAFPWRAGTATADGRRSIITIAQPQPNHNGGGIAIDAAGDLWIGVGDGGGAGDAGPGHVEGGNAQSLRQVLGKLLRITPTPTGRDPYTIPPDNPFVTATRGQRPEIFASGLRNPWRFVVDEPTRSLWIADVGQNEWEEVNAISLRAGSGANFGWNVFEGTHRFREGTAERAVDPVFEYAHAGDSCSVTGGVVARDRRLPAPLQGAYLFADFCSGQLSAVLTSQNLRTLQLDVQVDAPSTFGIAPDGSVLVVSLRGTVSRLVPR